MLHMFEPQNFVMFEEVLTENSHETTKDKSKMNTTKDSIWHETCPEW